MQISSWKEIDEGLKVFQILIADAQRLLIGGERGEQVAKSMLGVNSLPAGLLDEWIEDEAFLASVQIDQMPLYDYVRNCFDTISKNTPINSINRDDLWHEGAEWLEYALSMAPRIAMGGMDYTGIVHNENSSLQKLLWAALALVDLADYVQNPAEWARGSVSLSTISTLSGTSVRTVRNVMGPKGNKPIKSTDSLQRDERKNHFVHGEALDVLEWLSGRRNFGVGPLSVVWVQEQLEELTERSSVVAAPGLLAWLNKTKTEKVAAKVGWVPAKVSAWFRNQVDEPEAAKMLAEAVGMDGDVYQEHVTRVWEKG